MKRARGRREEGFALVFTALSLSALMIVAAIVLDIGYLRGSANFDQRTADLAVLAAGRKLGAANYEGACEDIIKYLNTNAADMPAINPLSFCTQSGNNVGNTTCDAGGTLEEAKPTVTSGRYTVSVHFPVPNDEIADPVWGAGNRDGTPCGRIRVLVTTTEPSFFGHIVGSSGYTTTRTATARALPGKVKHIPALWLLDPTGCTALSVQASHVTVGTAEVPGVTNVDSDGSTCTGSQVTVSAGGTGAALYSVPTTGTDPGTINLFAMAPGDTSCTGHACDPADVLGGRIAPQPQPSVQRATRSPIDWRVNCKASYPLYHGIEIQGCPYSTPPYLDNLKAAIGTSGQPSGYLKWSTYYSCNPTGTIVATGNYWIDCNGQGISIGNNTDVTINGNVVVDKGIQQTGGVLRINTGNPAVNLTNGCLPPAVVTPCTTTSSQNAAILYIRSGDISPTGGSLIFNHVFTYVANGIVKINSAPPQWTQPTEGPFLGLSLYDETVSNAFQIAGGAGVTLGGAFFTPEANPMGLSGNSDWGQQNAQFISFHLAVSGSGNVSLSPDPNTSFNLPPDGATLIR